MTDYASVQVWGPARSKALAECHEQISQWGLKMPEVEPLVLHFGLDEFPRFGLTEFHLANSQEFGYCGKLLFLFEDQCCPSHYHKVKHETFFVLKGKIEMTVDDRPQTMVQGDLLVMPTGKRHKFLGIEPSLIIEASMPSFSGDNFFDDKRIGTGGVV